MTFLYYLDAITGRRMDVEPDRLVKDLAILAIIIRPISSSPCVTFVISCSVSRLDVVAIPISMGRAINTVASRVLNIVAILVDVLNVSVRSVPLPRKTHQSIKGYTQPWLF